MMIWGVISTSTAACHSYSGLLAARFFLGFVEAAYFVGCICFAGSRISSLTFTARLSLLLELLVYTERARYSNYVPLCRRLDCRRLLWPDSSRHYR